MAKHYRIGGSTAERTLNCPAWISAVEKLPKIERSSPAAERGTAMHEVMEHVLMTDWTIQEAADQVAFDFDSYDLDQMSSALRSVEHLWTKYQIKEFETEVLMSINEDVGGSCDVLAAGDDWVLLIDFKFGRVPVDPDNNPQLLFYRWLATQTPAVRDMTEGKKFAGVIIQPAVSSDPAIYEFADHELDAFDERIRHAIDRGLNYDDEPIAGSHCAYCPAEPYCGPRRKLVSQTRTISLDNVDSLARALDLLPELERFIKATKAEALAVMETLGVKIPGYKLVAKKELRKFSDPDLTAAALLQAGVQNIFTDPLLKSPAQIEKTLKAEQIVFDLSPWLKEASGEREITNDRDKRAEVKKDVVSINICGMLSNSSSVTE